MIRLTRAHERNTERNHLRWRAEAKYRLIENGPKEVGSNPSASVKSWRSRISTSAWCAQDQDVGCEVNTREELLTKSDSKSCITCWLCVQTYTDYADGDLFLIGECMFSVLKTLQCTSFTLSAAENSKQFLVLLKDRNMEAHRFATRGHAHCTDTRSDCGHRARSCAVCDSSYP